MMGFYGLRAPRVMLLRTRCLLVGWRDMSERLSDHLRHPGRNALELRKLVSTYPELVRICCNLEVQPLQMPF
jgi:hypothetical protein